MYEEQNDEIEDVLPYTEELRELLLTSMLQAVMRGEEDAQPEHLLLALAGDMDRVYQLTQPSAQYRGRGILLQAGVDCDELTAELNVALGPPHDNPLWEEYQRSQFSNAAVGQKATGRLDQSRGDNEIEWDRAVAEAVTIIQASTPMPGRWSDVLKRIVKAAVKEAQDAGVRLASTSYILIAILQENNSEAAEMLKRRGVSLERLRALIQDTTSYSVGDK